jgi:hypothetical protein
MRKKAKIAVRVDSPGPLAETYRLDFQGPGAAVQAFPVRVERS